MVVWSDARGTVKNTFRENERKKGDEGRALRRDSADGTFSAMALKRQAQLGISRFGVVLLALLAAVRARTATGPVRRLAWDFEQGGDRLASNAGGGVTAAARGCGRAQGVRGRALALDGRHGMVIPASTGFHARTGMTLECWVYFRALPGKDGPVNLVSKPGEFMLRKDPARAGGKISFYLLDAQGRWEPRVRSSQPALGKWLHLTAVWDRRRLYLWFGRQVYSVKRAGKCTPADTPIFAGGPVPELGLAGLDGRLDGLRLWNRPLPGRRITRMMYGLPPAKTGGAGRRTNGNFDFEAGSEGWSGDVPVAVEAGALRAELRPGETLLRRPGLRLEAAQCPVVSIRLAVTGAGAHRGVLTFAGDRMCKDVPFRLVPDGRFRWYTLRCSQQPPWAGFIDTLAFRVDGPGTVPVTVRIEALRMGTASAAPPDPRLLSLAPERRINPLDTPAAVTAWVRNFGGTARGVSLHLEAGAGIEVCGAADRQMTELGFDETRSVSWRIRAHRPAAGIVRVRLRRGDSPPVFMERPVRFSPDPAAASAALARERTWRRAGYPRAMDFRHLWPWSERFLEHDTALLVDLAGDKIATAIDYKRRYPDRLVLMQINDEPNGLWGSWHCVPREFVVKEGLRADPMIFPMPAFRGYWLLGPAVRLANEFPATAERMAVRVSDPGRFVLDSKYSGGRELRDVLLYAVDRAGKPMWESSEYASVTAVDAAAGVVSVRRWPRRAVGAWHDFPAGSRMAPSVGDIYRMGGKVIKTWVPNLTDFCPRDPRTGLTARAWWARHFARLWHARIARSEPHPDGIEFDGLRAGRLSDCNLDGAADGCVLGGVDQWLLGLYEFFRLLRAGGPGWKGLGDALILADSGLWAPRAPALLNGAESEEFPSFSGLRYFPTGMDLFRLWCSRSARPACSYVQERYGCDTYLERDWNGLRKVEKFHPDSAVRLSIAAACMGSGITTYRTGSRRDVHAILGFDRAIVEYPWDEYCAGRLGRFNWLGRPLGPARRFLDHLGPDLLPEHAAGGWRVRGEGLGKEGPARRVSRAGAVWFGLAVAPPSSVRPWGGVGTARRAMLCSPFSKEPLDAGCEYAVTLEAAARGMVPGAASQRYGGVLRVLGLALEDRGGRLGLVQWVLAGERPRRIAVTLRPPPGGGRCRVALLAGWGIGTVRVTGVRLRQGCAEVFARRFEHGLALANGSATSPFTFDLKRLDPGRRFRRFPGIQAPDVNDGRPVGDRVTLPPSDGLLLMTREEALPARARRP